MVDHEWQKVKQELGPLLAAYKRVRAPNHLASKIRANLPTPRHRRLGLPLLLGMTTMVFVLVAVMLVQLPQKQVEQKKYPSLSMIDLSGVSKSKVRLPSSTVHVPMRVPKLPSKPKIPEVSQDGEVLKNLNQFANTEEYHHATPIG